MSNFEAFNAAIAGIPAQPFNNYYATTAPGATNDSAEGYSVGSKWYNSVTKETYVCSDATEGAAVWDDATVTADELGSAAFSDTEDFATAAQGDLADSSLQPVAVDYRGEYDNGDNTYAIGSVVLFEGLLYEKISNPLNPGYPPYGEDWDLFVPMIGSPAYDLWVQTSFAALPDTYLPLAGGVMDVYAAIGWANGSAIREAGDQGLEIECSVGYRWQWVAGRMILRMVNSEQIARIIAIDGVAPSVTDDITAGFVPGTRWEMADGMVYLCTDATEGAAVWIEAPVNHIPFDTAGGTLDALGQVAWDADAETLAVVLKNDTILQVGEETLYHVENVTGSTIDKGTPVMYAGTTGNSGKLQVQPWDGTSPKAFLGIATSDILDEDTGYVTHFGKARGFQTDGDNYGETWASGEIIYAVSGSNNLTNVTPTTGGYVTVAVVIAAHATNGTLFVRPTQVSTASEIGAVTAYDSNDSLSIDSENRQLVDSSGFVVMDWDGYDQHPYFPYGISVGASSIEMGGGSALLDGALTHSMNNILTWFGGALKFPLGVQDSSGNNSISSEYRQLIGTDSGVNLDWSDPDGKIYLGNASDDPTSLCWIQNNFDLRLAGGTSYGVIAQNYFIAEAGIHSSSGSGGQVMSVDPNNRELYASDGVTSALDWNNRYLRDTVGYYALDWANRQLIGNDGFVRMDWENGYLGSNSHRISFQEGQLQLYNGSVFDATVDYVGQDLYASDSGGGQTVSVDWLNRNLYAADGTTITVYWWDGGLSDLSGVAAANWVSRLLYDGVGASSTDWENRQLIAYDGTTVMLDWETPNSMMLMGSNILSDGLGALEFTAGLLTPGIFAGSFSGGFSEAINVNNRQLLNSSGFVALDWSSGYADAYGFTTNGVAAQFPFGITAQGNTTLAGVTETAVAVGDSGATQTLDIDGGTFQTVTLTQSCVFTMPAADAIKSFVLKVLTGAGGYTATFTDVKWPDDAAPVITTAAGRYDLISFVADGTAWSGSAIQNFTA